MYGISESTAQNLHDTIAALDSDIAKLETTLMQLKTLREQISTSLNEEPINTETNNAKPIKQKTQIRTRKSRHAKPIRIEDTQTNFIIDFHSRVLAERYLGVANSTIAKYFKTHGNEYITPKGFKISAIETPEFLDALQQRTSNLSYQDIESGIVYTDIDQAVYETHKSKAEIVRAMLQSA